MGATRIPINKFIQDAAGGTTWTTAWRTMVNGLSADIYEVELFNSGGEVMEIGVGTGTAAVTALNYYVIPGGPAGRIGLHLNADMKVFFRCAQNVTVSSGLFIANFLR